MEPTIYAFLAVLIAATLLSVLVTAKMRGWWPFLPLTSTSPVTNAFSDNRTVIYQRGEVIVCPDCNTDLAVFKCDVRVCDPARSEDLLPLANRFGMQDLSFGSNMRCSACATPFSFYDDELGLIKLTRIGEKLISSHEKRKIIHA